MSEKVEQLFAVQLTSSPTSWGERWEVAIVNPDGSVCVRHDWECGPDGFTNAQENGIAEWVGEEASEFISTMFDSWLEQSQAGRMGL